VPHLVGTNAYNLRAYCRSRETSEGAMIHSLRHKAVAMQNGNSDVKPSKLACGFCLGLGAKTSADV